MNQLTINQKNKNNPMTIDSRDVAEMLDKQHKYVLRDIEGTNKVVGIIPTLLSANLHPVDYFIESNYKDTSGKTNKCYLVTKMGCELLGNKQQGEKGILFTAKYVKRFNEMEESLLVQPQYRLPQTYKEALLQLVEAEEEKERLQIELTNSQKEVEYKENVIIGLVDEIDLATKRQRINQVIRKAPTYKIKERWSKLYREFELKYHCNIDTRLENYNKSSKPKMKNKLEYIEKVMEMIPQLYEISCKLYENDMKSLVDEMYELNN